MCDELEGRRCCVGGGYVGGCCGGGCGSRPVLVLVVILVPVVIWLMLLLLWLWLVLVGKELTVVWSVLPVAIERYDGG